MTQSPRQIQVLYEISLAIGRGDGVEETARTALSAYLQKLNCVAGGVLEHTDGRYESVATIPRRPATNDGYREAREWLGERPPEQAALPNRLSIDETTRGHVFELPEFGVLILVETGEPLAAELVAALGTLNRKLGDACRSERVEQRLREQRNRFETAIETIPEPMVNLVIDDEPVVRGVNSAFAETFGCDPSAVTGQPLETVFEGELSHDWRDQPMKLEQERETTDGRRTFSVRTAPVETAGDRREQFGLYVDVTDTQRRAQTLEQLYRAARRLVEADDAYSACEQAIETATELLEYTACGIHRYDRAIEGLVPFVTRRTRSVLDSPPKPYTDKQSIVWRAYRSQESVLVEDTETFDGRLPGGETNARSGLVLPVGNHGVLIASSNTPGAFDESDREFGQLLAAMLRTALDRTERERTLQAVQQTTQTLVTAEDTQTACELLVERVSESFGFPNAGVWLFDQANTCLRPAAISDAGQELVDEVPTFEPGNSIAWKVFESGEPRLVEDTADSDDAYDSDSVIGSEVIVPIGEYGVLVAGSKLDRDTSPSEFDALQTLVTGAESAIQIIEQRAELNVLDQILARILRHNIRNDLTVIRGRAERIARIGDGEIREDADRILAKSDQLLTTAENAKQIRDVVDRRGEQRTVDLAAVVTSAVETVRANWSNATVRFDAAARPEVSVHPDFEYAVRHAIENGVQHNPAPRPTVRVRLTSQDRGVQVVIDDDGSGIPSPEMDPIRNRAETDLSHGSGVGLWIIDRVVEYSGGVVHFDTDDTGTTVTILL